jgi:thiamine-monophosphate kinase
MKIKSEWNLLDKIKSAIDTQGLKKPESLFKSIGDDCAVFEIDANRYGLITTDISIEGTHFKRDLCKAQDIGFKAMMGNISDITAMGGSARYAFVSIGLQKTSDDRYVQNLYKGMIEAANMAGAVIAGGDISRSEQLVINIALYGEAQKKRLITRSGAKAGDYVYITGSVGDSMAGLEILQSGEKKAAKKYPGLLKKHTRPVARFNIIQEIINLFSPGAMIDVSDGVISDLRQICRESSGGFIINESNLPLSNELLKYAAQRKINPYEYALKSGEEFELLFTSQKNITDTMNININDINIALIGTICKNGFFIRRNNKLIKAPIRGYDHFKE